MCVLKMKWQQTENKDLCNSKYIMSSKTIFSYYVEKLKITFDT